MNETHDSAADQNGAPDDPSAAVADSQAPTHLEERGLDSDLEAALDNGSRKHPLAQDAAKPADPGQEH